MALDTALLDSAREHRASEIDRLANLRADARLRLHTANTYIEEAVNNLMIYGTSEEQLRVQRSTQNDMIERLFVLPRGNDELEDVSQHDIIDGADR